MVKVNDFQTIVINDTPLIDVRAPIEFAKGSIPNAVNLPLINDEERHLIGLTYKEQGSDKALELGYELVSGEMKNVRVSLWLERIAEHPESIIYCFRGGERSRITQNWIQEASGKTIPYIEGGYKAFRNYLLTELLPENVSSKPVLITGYTGSGKTGLLSKFPNFINLEKIANHRGSSFGGYLTPQPSQSDFENQLAYELIKLKHKGFKYLLLENEGRNIGKSYLPKDLAAYFAAGPLIVLEVPLDKRIENILNEYVITFQEEFQKVYQDKGLELWREHMHRSINNLERRLGKERHQHIVKLFENAYSNQLAEGSFSSHEAWISALLTDYYDLCYEYEAKKNADRIIFRGNSTEVLEYINYRYNK